MKQAQFYTIKDNQKIQCLLCPHKCIISPDKRGICQVRKNINGQLIAETYGYISAFNFDIIEKKPLYHFHPGSVILSIGNIGCNLSCSFCQNCEISQTNIDEFPYLKEANIENIIDAALKKDNNAGIAYTYNEPTVWYEFMYDTAKKANESALKNIMVSNGFINQEPLEKLLPFMDAFNIDLKAFTEDFYQKITGAKLAPVLETIKTIKKANKHLEITNLIIPGLNDNPKIFEDMVVWIKNNTGKDTVLHLSRYFPRNQLDNEMTPMKTLVDLKIIAEKHLDYVYLGNV